MNYLDSFNFRIIRTSYILDPLPDGFQNGDTITSDNPNDNR